jgi:hypothetical protein
VTVCSLEAARVGEPLPGTAPLARGWLVLEHPGPWGRDAVADSDLPDAVRTHLLTAKEHGLTVLLARRPDRPGRIRADATQVWVARSAPGGLRMRVGTLTDLADLIHWDLAAIGAGTLPAFGEATDEPLLLVCTHSRRDRCCAVYGRGLVNALLAAQAGADTVPVWECSHIGGHRFTPVTLTLPSGVVHGRFEPTDAPALLEAVATGRVLPDHLRGRSALPGPLQAAEVAVRRATGIDDDAALDVLHVIDGRARPSHLRAPFVADEIAEVRHRDGRAWRVEVHLRDLAEPRPESCGKEALLGAAWECDEPVVATPWS